MPSFYEDEEMPLPLLHRASRRPGRELERDNDFLDVGDEWPIRKDRMRPFTAGCLAGLFAGPAGFGVVHVLRPVQIGHLFAGGAAQWGVSLEVSTGIAYGTAAASGALVCAAFASITRHLRRFVPLILWAQIFFVSLTLLVLAAMRTYANGAGTTFTSAVLAASAAFAFVSSFQLPLRRRG